VRHDCQAAIQVPQQRTVHARQVANTSAECGEFFFEVDNGRSIRRRIGRQIGGWIGGRFPRTRWTAFRRTVELIFHKTPLAAEFRLVSGTARDYFSVVAGKRKLADLKTLYEVAQQTDPHLHQFAGLAWNRVHIKPGRRPGG
jgi:hypothetical protein